MFNHCGFEAEKVRKSEIVRKLQSFLVMRAHAEEVPSDEGVTPPTEEGTQTPPTYYINYEQLIAQARKEEKEKLYPRLKKLEDENKEYVKTSNAQLIKIGQLQQQLEESQKKGDDSQAIKDLKAQIVTLTEENKTLKESTPKEEELRASIKAEYEVQMYVLEQISKNKDTILPVFESDVKGATKEEVDASLQNAITKTIETKKALGLLDENGNPIETTKKSNNKKPPVANPTSGEEKAFDIDYVRNLDPKSAEYKEWRKKQGLK